MYSLWIGLGIIAAFFVLRWQQRIRPSAQRAQLALPAIIGAVLGAHLFHAAAVSLQLVTEEQTWHQSVFGGRTMLGGIIGGWFAVECWKYIKGIRVLTGDGFAAPLALALCLGRIACIQAGCCAGAACSADHVLAITNMQGELHVGIPIIESVFHGIAAVLIMWAFAKGVAKNRLLYLYVSTYAVLRFICEFWRVHPDVGIGLTYYQILAIALLIAAVLKIMLMDDRNQNVNQQVEA